MLSQATIYTVTKTHTCSSIIWLVKYLVCREVEADDPVDWLFPVGNFLLPTMTSPPGYVGMTSSVRFRRGVERLRVTDDITSGYLLARSSLAW